MESSNFTSLPFGIQFSRGHQVVESPVSMLQGTWVTGILTVLYLLYVYISHRVKYSRFPLINGGGPFDFITAKSKEVYLHHAHDLLEQGIREAPDGFYLKSDTDTILILPPRYAEELRRDPCLNFEKTIHKSFFIGIPGFEPLNVGANGGVSIPGVIRTSLTQALGGVSAFLSVEATDALNKHWGNSEEWHAVPLKLSVLSTVAQMSARIFLGPELCRNMEWLQVQIGYTINASMAGKVLRMYPKFMVPLVHRWVSVMNKTRASLNRARELIGPIVEKRRQEYHEAKASGDYSKRSLDTVAWMEEMSDGIPYDAAAAQLSLSFLANHTTSDHMSQCLIDLCKHPELIQPLRDEVISVLREHGWEKTSFQHMKLMDSFFKESQRFKPLAKISMPRIADKDFYTSDGIKIAKDSQVAVSMQTSFDPELLDKPYEFNAYRWLNRSKTPELWATSQFVTASPEHLCFGYGRHACPGRFFASNEEKILLSHILLKYDFKLPEGVNTQTVHRGYANDVNPTIQLMVRHRPAPEIDLEEMTAAASMSA